MRSLSLERLTILLVSTDPDQADLLARQLTAAGAEVARSAPEVPLERAFAAHTADALLLHLARSEPSFLAGLGALAAQAPCALLLDRDDADFMIAAIAAGVSAYATTEAALLDPKPILRSAIAVFEREQRLTAELQRVRELLAEQRLVARAKTLLMQQHRMSEAAAYRWLQRRAMNSGRRIPEVAAEVVDRLNL